MIKRRLTAVLLAICFACSAGITDAWAVRKGGAFRPTAAIGKAASPKFKIHKQAKKPKPVYVSKQRYPESAKHIQDAQKTGAPKVLTVDRSGAAQRRREALAGKPTVPAKDRDEYPPAMMREGGKGASVRPVTPADNRGAGACIGAQCKDVPDGGKVQVKVTK